MDSEAKSRYKDYYKSLLTYKRAIDLERDTHISLKNRFVYIMVGKAASSTVTYHLQWAEYRGTRFSPQNVNSRYQSPHLAPFQLRKKTFYSIMNGDRFKKVTFVRNPYSRLLSCYLHRIVGSSKKNPSKRALYRSFKGPRPQKFSFETFVDIICDQENRKMERHWAVQHDTTLYPLVKYDFIGKQERLQEDLIALEKLVFRKIVFDRDKLSSVNMAPMQTGSSNKLRDYYTDRIASKVAERYKIDFETFGYSTDLD